MAVNWTGQTKTVDALTESTSPADTDCMMIATDATIKKIKWSTIINLIKVKLGIGTAADLTTTSKEIVGAINEINSALLYTPPIFDTTRDGTSFDRDFRSINLASQQNRRNAPNYFSKPADDSDWKNIPPEMQGHLWLGYRETQRMTANNCLVRITEHFPVQGRIWTCYYNTGTWSDWQKITDAGHHTHTKSQITDIDSDLKSIYRNSYPSSKNGGGTCYENVKYVSLEAADGPYNINMCYSQNSDSAYINGLPEELDGKTLVAFRRVHYQASNHILIELIEAFPVTGRVWYNFYNVNNWSGWKKITPS